MMAILLSITSVIAIVYVLLRRWNLQRKTANIMTLPGEIPLLGHLHQIGGDASTIWNFFTTSGNTTNELGGISKLWFGPYLFIVITDPELHRGILNVVLDKSAEYKFMKSWIAQGMVTADVPTWKRHRKLLNPTFSQQMLNGFLHIMNNEAAQLLEALDQKVGKGEFDVLPYTNDYSFNTIIKTAIVVNQPLDFIREYSRLVELMFNIGRVRFQNLFMRIDWLYRWTNTKKREDEVVKNLIKLSTDVINKKKASLNVDDSDNHTKTFLDVFLKLEEDGTLTQQEIREEVDTIIAAGSDTTANALVYILVMLGSYPQVQDKVYSELNGIFGNNNRDVTKEDMPLLVYTEAAIKEVLRIYPLVPILGRIVRDRDLKIGKYTIPKDCTILLNTIGMHMGASWGDDAEVFRPERWLTPGGVTDLASCYAPFGSGRRTCIGKVYAMMSMKLSVAHVIRRYKVTADVTRLKSNWSVLLKPASGAEISIELR